MRFFVHAPPWLKSANEGVMLFYILHQTILLGIGFFVIALDIHDLIKWVIIFVFSFVVIITLKNRVVIKIDLFRFLFGMKTSHEVFDVFRSKKTLFVIHIFYIGLIVFAGFNNVIGYGRDRTPMPFKYEPKQDIVLDISSITEYSSSGVRLAEDADTSTGEAIEFYFLNYRFKTFAFRRINLAFFLEFAFTS